MQNTLKIIRLLIHIMGILIFESRAYKLGSTYKFINMMDQLVLTVNKEGYVIMDTDKNSPEQKWTIIQHSEEPEGVEFKQALVPFNVLSGWEKTKDGGGPRALKIIEKGTYGPDKVQVYEIRIHIMRPSCLESNGQGWDAGQTPCENYVAPWQLWEFKEVS